MEFLSRQSHLKFHVSGVEHSVSTEDVTPETTLNAYLRQKSHLTGTKRMCLEGGCGSCVVAVEEIVNNERHIFAVNSCLVSIFSCHGWKIQTVEGIGGPLTKYHPVQRLLADNNGTQCGFCSSGMVMNMYALHSAGPKTQKQIEDAFGGNLCRCTGYRPILTAFKKLASDADEKIIPESTDIEDIRICQKGDCIRDCNDCEKKKINFYFPIRTSKWLKVHYIKDILQVLRTSGESTYMLVAGNTARGVYGENIPSDIYIDVTSVDDLRAYVFKNNQLVLGGNFTLTHAIELFGKISKENENFAYLSSVMEHINLIANVPVRNIGTLAGNLMIKYKQNDFPSDIFLILETYNAVIVIVDSAEHEVSVSPQQFLKLDMKKKIIKHIILPSYDSSYKFVSYKIMGRAQNTHALVNAGFLLEFDSQKNVVSARIVYGAINTDFVHATNTENYLKGKSLFDNTILQGALKTLDNELHPDYVLPDAKPEFRKLLAVSLFYKFVLSIAPDNVIGSRYKSGGSLLERPVSSGIQEFGTNKANYPLTEPVIKVEALAQTSGEAQYIDDVPDLPNQLFAAFVTAKAAANSQIVSINTTKALDMKGVVAFFGKEDIPGENTFAPKIGGFPVQEELFCSGRVQYYDQPVGIIVANNHDLAIQAAEMVEVTYSKPQVKPYLTIKDVLKAKDQARIHHQSTIVPKSRGTDVQHVVKGDFYIGMQYHFHMEVQCCNVVPTEDSIELYPSTQWMDLAQIACSVALNIPMNRINVHVRRLGGGFGAKIMRNTIVSTAAALAALKLRTPVKMWMPLKTNINVLGKRYPLYSTYEVGVNNKGAIQYLEADLYSDFGVGGNEPIDSLLLDLFGNCYDISRWSFSTYTVTTDTHANCYCRAPGTLEGLGCIDSIMEHIAYSINMDTADVKRVNFDETKHPKAVKFWDEMQTWGDIVQRKNYIKTFNTANRWRKRGMSLVPMAWTLEVEYNFSVLVSIFHGDGSVVVSHGGIEIGQGINTKVVQVCAYKLGIPMNMVSVKPSYNVIAANCSTTGGSGTSESVCYAVIKACDTLLSRMKSIREKMKNPSWADLVNKCFASNIQLTASGFYSQDEPGIQQYFIYGVCATEVEVDILTGKYQILRVDIIEDTGESMSPLIDIGQVEGAFVMGIGYYTTEEIIFNDQGEILTNRTWNYRVPGAKDIPISFRIKFPENNPNPVGVLKAKAVAEPPSCISCSVPLAIRNALASARQEADPKQPKWYPFDGTSSVENTLSNSLNTYNQYVL